MCTNGKHVIEVFETRFLISRKRKLSYMIKHAFALLSIIFKKLNVFFLNERLMTNFFFMFYHCEKLFINSSLVKVKKQLAFFVSMKFP